MQKRRHIIFLRDVLVISLTAFGGPQAHLVMFLKTFVNKRGYLTEEELMELTALCQILPGPTSTQTITAIGFKKGGAGLAYLTLLVWVFPAVSVMIFLAVGLQYFVSTGLDLSFTRYIQPMAVSFVGYGAFRITEKVVKTKTAFILMVLSAAVGFLFKNPLVFPSVLLVAGLATALRFEKQKKEEKQAFQIEWANFILYAGVFIVAAFLGEATKILPIRLFENFYRNGSLIFGGGQVLAPAMFTEFVQFKKYLSSEEFLSGYAMVQALPGPVFAFCSYIGALAMRTHGLWGQIFGGLIAAAGIFLPGTFLIFFVIRVWDQLKKFRPIKASLEGINAASSGLVLAATFLLGQSVEVSLVNYAIIVLVFVLLLTEKIPSFLIVLLGLGFGFAA